MTKLMEIDATLTVPHEITVIGPDTEPTREGMCFQTTDERPVYVNGQRIGRALDWPVFEIEGNPYSARYVRGTTLRVALEVGTPDEVISMKAADFFEIAEPVFSMAISHGLNNKGMNCEYWSRSYAGRLLEEFERRL